MRSEQTMEFSDGINIFSHRRRFLTRRLPNCPVISLLIAFDLFFSHLKHLVSMWGKALRTINSIKRLWRSNLRDFSLLQSWLGSSSISMLEHIITTQPRAYNLAHSTSSVDSFSLLVLVLLCFETTSLILLLFYTPFRDRLYTSSAFWGGMGDEKKNKKDEKESS